MRTITNQEMIQILILIFIGRWLYQLAKKFKKPNSWLYGLLAVVTYFVSSFIFGAIIALILLALGHDLYFTQGEELLLSLAGIPAGFGGVALLHYLLKRKWKREDTSDRGLLDDTIEELSE
ncbi:MAG: hypothetical protein DCO96_11620 [Fluviicola sp. XM-24bin1]|nr:MAG: hypothetical protein DCO96_11620 [Fluviicola sp. XM-24bin1]